MTGGPAAPGRYTCSCGATSCVRVKVARPDGSTYVTEFAACAGCGVMYHRPEALPGERGGIPVGYMQPMGATVSGLPPMGEDDLREIREAAARASRSKRRR